MSIKNKYCCSNHVDAAFDDYLVENETFPYLQKINKDGQNVCCSYCENTAIYKLSDKNF